MIKKKIILATRKSPLALAQAELLRKQLLQAFPDCATTLLPMTTTGDEQKNWSLEKQGGKGLFTKEIEEAVLEGRADLAVHSAKDLPTDMPDGLSFAGCLSRENVNDVLIVRDGIMKPASIATSSPRRRAQMSVLHPDAVFVEVRGNIETRLRKVADGLADATVMAAAGLKRLGIHTFPGLVFAPLSIRACVPAAGQGAIAIQCRADDARFFSGIFDAETYSCVMAERLLLNELGAGCHSAFAVHATAKGEFHIFQEGFGYSRYDLPDDENERVGLIKAIACEMRLCKDES